MDKDIELVYKNIDNMTDKKFNEYLKTIPGEVAQKIKKDLFENNGLDRFIDIRKSMRCMQISDLADR